MRAERAVLFQSFVWAERAVPLIPAKKILTAILCTLATIIRTTLRLQFNLKRQTMKKLFLTIILTSTILTTFGQDSTKTKGYNNEFGIDATAFIKQFFNLNSAQYPDNYSATYYLTYRRHFKCGNIRFAIGGSYADYDLSSGWQADSNKYHYNSYSISSRIGWEFFSNLSKRWQTFYGLDFRPTIAYTKNDAPYWNGGYANGYESKSQIYSIAPLLGFRFRLNDRLSISTETSFSINWQVDNNRKYFIPMKSTDPPLPDIVSPKTKKLVTGFSQPISLILTFDI